MSRNSLFPAPPGSVGALLLAGLILGAVADTLLRAPGPPGVNMSLFIAAVAVAALALNRRAALPLDRERAAWLGVGVLFAAGLAWRDSPPLKLLALACATTAFALAAYRPVAVWVRRAGVVRYAGALALAALHAWAAAVPVLVNVALSVSSPAAGRTARWRTAAAVGRGLVIAAPLVGVFAALFVSADAVFAEMVASVVRVDTEWMASHVVLFSLFAWLSIGYLRGFLAGTDQPLPFDVGEVIGRRGAPAPKGLGITEVVTALAAIDALFLVFVLVQFRYLFGADAVVQATPDLTYADYARRGFFELVFAVVLVVPVLLAADWLVDRREQRDVLLFRVLAGAQVGLILLIGASALHRLRLYHAAYGLTESRFHATVLLIWIAVVLCWLAATVLRGRRESFAFGALTSGMATVAALYVVNPDAVIARTNLARITSIEASARFDVAYATSLSADAVPALIDVLPTLPVDVQCPLAKHMLRGWPPGAPRSIRSWNWSGARASEAVREHEAQLHMMVAARPQCESPRR